MHSDKCKRAIKRALRLIEEESAIYDATSAFTTVNASKSYWKLRLSGLRNEQFDVMYLNNKHKIIACETLFTGTINTCGVYSRVVIQRILHLNAAAVMFAHNHPSGLSTPSKSDKVITKRLKDACDLIDVQVLDHIIVGTDCYSFAENGLI